MADHKFEPEVRRGLKHLKSNIPLAIECKKREDARLPFDQLKEHQIQALSEFQASPFFWKIAVPAPVGINSDRRFNLPTPFDYVYTGPGKAYVLVNFRFTRKSPRKDIKKGVNRCFAVGIGQYKMAVALLGAEGKKSIPYDWFCEYAQELARTKFDDGYGWDLTPLAGEKGA